MSLKQFTPNHFTYTRHWLVGGSKEEEEEEELLNWDEEAAARLSLVLRFRMWIKGTSAKRATEFTCGLPCLVLRVLQGRVRSYLLWSYQGGLFGCLLLGIGPGFGVPVWFPRKTTGKGAPQKSKPKHCLVCGFGISGRMSTGTWSGCAPSASAPTTRSLGTLRGTDGADVWVRSHKWAPPVGCFF